MDDKSFLQYCVISTMKRYFKPFFFSVLIICLVAACAQLKQLHSFAKCEFRMSDIRQVEVAGVNTTGKESLSDFNFLELTQLSAAYFSGDMPLNLIVDVDVKNPNAETAALNSVEWIAMLDGTQIATNTISNRIEISPNGGIQTIPIKVNADLKELFSSKSKDSMLNLILNLFGESNEPSKLKLKLKPSLLVRGVNVGYPGYINVNKSFSSQ